MERAVFGASEFFSQKAFITGFRGIEKARTGYLKDSNVKIVELWFNPWKVSYDELVELFFDLHDPTAREGQLYKNQSYIFFSDLHQVTVAKQKKNELQHILNNEIITEITPVWEHNSF
ncbi:peptide-methionine (S)-S-oxide reductase [Neobacillus bataviensis]|uniref:peptide-methionine (S)-S-oxide reductase n=1 Tax=Neobacillus bataviensis TaxID=220685 RepID=UPI001CBE4621|nr:peptide-methionine (S)-S-oxide reductase [Neobacillus bataviensis]